jgi:hypothetical protein
MTKVYRNSAELMQLSGIPLYMKDMLDACLIARLNLFLQGDTGSGKTQLAKDAMTYFPDKNLFILGRNDMDTRELFQQINLGKFHKRPSYNLEPIINPDSGEVEYYYPKVDEKGIFVYQKLTKDQADIVKGGLEALSNSTENIKELTSRINTNLIVVDELPNCVPAVRAQLFNLFDGFIEINGKPYSIGQGYSTGIATGNIGQKFTESSNEIGRALRDRMHVIIDTDYFFPKASDTFEILAGNTNPRVEFTQDSTDKSLDIIDKYRVLSKKEVPPEKLIIANYLLHGLDHCSMGSKREMKDAWPTQLESHEQGSDVGLVLPVSIRAAKSIVGLSQALDSKVEEKAGKPDYFDSMMQAYKFVAAYSGVLNDSAVKANYAGNNYKALDAVISTTKTQFKQQEDAILSGTEMILSGKSKQKVLDSFKDRWAFMRNTLEALVNHYKNRSGA